MFKDEIVNSLIILDNEYITLIYSNNRQIFQVKNNDKNKVHYCFKHTYYCTCSSFASKS